VEESLLNIKRGGLYVAPWKYTFMEYFIEKGDLIVILEVKKLDFEYTNIDAAHYMVKALLSTGDVVKFRASESALKNHWKRV